METFDFNFLGIPRMELRRFDRTVRFVSEICFGK